MASKVTPEFKNAEAAISSLYDLFPKPETRYNSCPTVKTKELASLDKRIAARKKELDDVAEKDSKLIKLQEQRKDLHCDTVKRADTLHRRVDELMRRLRVRGVTEELLDGIEQLSKEKPAIDACFCEDED
jgi:predicted oxidoreductase